MARFLIIFLFFYFSGANLLSQQNSTLFLMPGTPQANIVNPAVTNDCSLILGLPVISSVHLNAGNSGFSYNQILKKESLSKVNYFDTEIHTNLLFAGFWIKENFVTFSLNEKADLFLTYPGDLYALARNGNTQFEGEIARLGRSGLFLNYRREFAFGIARQTKSKLWWGARGKLLFGKLSTSTHKSKIDLYTDPFYLNFNSDWQLFTSLPLNVETTSAGNLVSADFNNASATEILFNRKNLGFSADLGFIKQLDNQVTISGSILDIGFINWKDNGFTFKQQGDFSYTGPVGDTIDDDNYIEGLTRVLKDEFGISASSQSSSLEIINPRVYLGISYKIRDDVAAGVVGTAKINRFKITKGLTLSLNKQFSEKFTGSVSYSYMYNDFKNIGLGFKAGQTPLQFYMVTDNVLGFIFPYSTRNANLRFGLQLNFGCDRETNFGGCGCEGMEKLVNHRQKMNKLLKKKNKYF